MKKVLCLIGSLLALIVGILLTYYKIVNNYLLVTTLIAVFVCVNFVLSFENKKIPVGRLAVIVTVSAICVAGRILFVFIPQVQPITALICLVGIFLGGRESVMCASVSAFLSNMVLGQGPWTLWQMLAWGIIGIIFSVIPKKTPKNILAVFGGLSAFLFSIITDIYTISSIGMGLKLKSILALFSAGLIFNLTHAVANAVLILLLYKPFKNAVSRLETKYPNLM